jgi:hypothetical protein
MSAAAFPDKKPEEDLSYAVEGIESDETSPIPSFTALIEEGENPLNPIC